MEMQHLKLWEQMLRNIACSTNLSSYMRCRWLHLFISPCISSPLPSYPTPSSLLSSLCSLLSSISFLLSSLSHSSLSLLSFCPSPITSSPPHSHSVFFSSTSNSHFVLPSPVSLSSFLVSSPLSNLLFFPHEYPTAFLHLDCLHLPLPQGAKVNVHDFDGSLAAPMRKYAGNPSVSYRPGWSLPDLYSGNGEQQTIMYETHAETACMWEHRIKAKWVQIIHSADNMASPISPHKTMAQVADSLDTQTVSGVLVPTCRESFPLAAADKYFGLYYHHVHDIPLSTRQMILPTGRSRSRPLTNHFFCFCLLFAVGNSPSSYRAPPQVSPHRYPFLGSYFLQVSYTSSKSLCLLTCLYEALPLPPPLSVHPMFNLLANLHGPAQPSLPLAK